jgi:membrane protein insertase Oxa1/YidC/SpoIIIJ
MNMQMKYIFPFIIIFIAYRISGAIALYWITSNLFTVGQQMYVNKNKKVMAPL